jgi:hypothetical protein
VLGILSFAIAGLVLWFVSAQRSSETVGPSDKSIESPDETTVKDDVVETMAPTATPAASSVVATTNKPTIRAATEQPLPTPPDQSSTSSMCAATHNCLTDRLGNNQYPIHQGEGLCNNEFYFGWSTDGKLIWRDCQKDVTNVIFDGSAGFAGSNYYFLLLDDASYNVYNNDQLIWTKHCLRKAELVPKCLSRPQLDCPYLHLHENGDLVLNSIDQPAHSWKARLSQDVYFDFFVSSMEPNPNSRSEDGYCDNFHHCLTDRIGNGDRFRLGIGKAVCNQNYMFGFTTDGVFQWKNCETNETRVMFDGSSHLDGDDDKGGSMYFELSDDASISIHKADQIMWSRNCTKTVSPTLECYDDPFLDCPFLHLHAGNAGDVILNYVDDQTNNWADRKMNRIYQNLFLV